MPVEARAGESRVFLLSSFPALSRVAAERAMNEPDTVVASWHVHYIVTTDGVSAIRLAVDRTNGTSGGVRSQSFEMSKVCEARLRTMALAMAAGVVLSPAGGFVAAATESAVWGDFGGAP